MWLHILFSFTIKGVVKLKNMRIYAENWDIRLLKIDWKDILIILFTTEQEQNSRWRLTKCVWWTMSVCTHVCVSDCSSDDLCTWTSGPQASVPACNLGVRRPRLLLFLPHFFLYRQLKGSLGPKPRLFPCCHDDVVSSVSMVIKGEEKQWRRGWERLTLDIKGRQNK